MIGNPSFDIEEIFSNIYDCGFELSAKNPLIEKYYQRYKQYRESEKENVSLSEKNEDLKQQLSDTKKDNDNLSNENNTLKQKVSSLQNMLKKTLEFCNHVKDSRFGRFFFRNKIKELPEPNNSEKAR